MFRDDMTHGEQVSSWRPIGSIHKWNGRTLKIAHIDILLERGSKSGVRLGSFVGEWTERIVPEAWRFRDLYVFPMGLVPAPIIKLISLCDRLSGLGLDQLRLLRRAGQCRGGCWPI